MMDAAGWVAQWCGSLSGEGWIIAHVTPVLLAAGAARLVTYIYRPRR